MNRKTLGIILALISSFSFGVAPVFASIALSEGSNGIMTMFLRNFLAIPILFFAILILKIKIKINIQLIKKLIILNVLGGALTGCLLFSAFQYTGIGLATCLHFVYPVIIMISCLIIFKERANVFKISALVISIVGIFFTVDISNFHLKGFSFALISGFTYAFYILYMDKSNIKNTNVLFITLIGCIINSICIGIFAVATDTFVYNLSVKGLGASLVVAILSTLIGVALLQVSLQYVDSSTASIMSTMEPLTSVFMGIIVLSEAVNPIKLLGCLLIILAVFIIAIDNRRGYIGNMNN